MKSLIFSIAYILSIIASGSNALAADAEKRTSLYFDHIRSHPVVLEMFLRELPKGGDLHNHLDGAIYAESFVKWAAEDGYCLDRSNFSFVPPPCTQTAITASDLPGKTGLYRQTIDALSMKDFKPDGESGHDHFFNSFSKFSLVAAHHNGDMLAEILNRAAAENVSYLELMTSPEMSDARAVSSRFSDNEDYDRLRERLLPDIGALVIKARQHLDEMETVAHKKLGCGTKNQALGCKVQVRYLAQVIRTFPLAQVFAQSLLGYALANEDPRVVGVNLVAPEDDPVTLRDYTQQMQQLQYLSHRYPAVKLSLHAGELAPGLVPPEDLRFHIAEAVKIAGAKRIGHGVDIAHEDQAAALLQKMSNDHVLVEINLTSNDIILGVKGSNHPFQTYWNAGVPLALSSDDEGVSRIDLTHEFDRAVLSYGLSYMDLKKLIRNSLEYSFLSGKSFWQSTDYRKSVPACGSIMSVSCQTFLRQNDKARMQGALEADFRHFEQTQWVY